MPASLSTARSSLARCAISALLSIATGSSTAEPLLRGSTTEGNIPSAASTNKFDFASTGSDDLSSVAANFAVPSPTSLSAKSSWCWLLPRFLQPTSCDPEQPARSETSSSRSAAAETGSYSEEEALELAYLSTAAFCSDWKLEDWKCGTACLHTPGMKDVRRADDDDLDAHGYVGRLNGQCVVAFRGTDSVFGWAQDLFSLQLRQLSNCSHDGESCHVGSGFLENYIALKDKLESELRDIGCNKSSPLAITGHSLGAAIAALAAFDLHRSGYNVTKVYTFGQPRVGDSAFASAFNSALTDVAFFRVTKFNDPIVHLPSTEHFHHVGTEVYYPGEDETDGYRVCDGSGEDSTCADENDAAGDVTGMIAECVVPSACRHLDYLMPLKQGRMGATSCETSGFFR